VRLEKSVRSPTDRGAVDRRSISAQACTEATCHEPAER
jgi:hypothetical protein